MNWGKVVFILPAMLALTLGLSSCSNIYPAPQQPVTTSTPNPQTTPVPGPASPSSPAPVTTPTQPEQSGPSSLGITYEVIPLKDPSWSLDRSKVIEYETGELEKGITLSIPPADLRIVPVTSTKDRRISSWGFSEIPHVKGEPENYIDFWVVNEWGGKVIQPYRTFNLHAQAITYDGTYYIYLSNQFDSTSAKEVVLQVKWVTPPPPAPPPPPPQPVSHSISQHQPFTIDMLANFDRPEDIHLFTIYLKANQRLHFTFSITQGQSAFWFATPYGKNIRLNTSGNLVETNLHDGEFIQLGNIVFKPSDYGWGEGNYEMTFGISDLGQNLNGENKAQVQVEYWIED
jgi:hypothetical protein